MNALTLDHLTSPLNTFLETVNLVPQPSGLGRLGNVDFYYHHTQRWCCVAYLGEDRPGFATYHDHLAFVTTTAFSLTLLDSMKIACSHKRRLWLVDADDLPMLKQEYGEALTVLDEV